MALGRFQLCLHSHMPYVLSHGKSPHGTDWINESAVECYLPLLDVLSRLEERGIKPRWTLNITPILAEQLADESFKNDFEGYCRDKIGYAEEDAEKFRKQNELGYVGLAEFWQRTFRKYLDQYQTRWGRSILEGFRHFQDNGSIELITSAATHGYLPLLGTDESVRAQVELGVRTYQKHFGRKPRGMWLPECAYRPGYDWKPPTFETAQVIPGSKRAGVDEILVESGIEYMFVDSHMVKGGQPLGTYASKFPQLAELFAQSSKFFVPPTDIRSEYEVYDLPSGMKIFARDPQTTVKVWSGDHGYPGDEHYLEFHKQLYPGRLRYWRVSQDKQDLGRKAPYDPWLAFERLGAHAQDMAETVGATLGSYRGVSGHEGTLTAMYDTELFGHWWWEGPEFLYELATRLDAIGQVRCMSGGEIVDEVPAHKTISLPEGSWGEGGYHYVWLNDANFWTWEKLYRAEQRLANLLLNSPDSDLERELVEQAARELLLAQSSDWQFLISTFSASDYSEVRIQDHLDRFNMLATMSQEIRNGNELSEAEKTYFYDCKDKDAPFQELDLSLWQTHHD